VSSNHHAGADTASRKGRVITLERWSKYLIKYCLDDGHEHGRAIHLPLAALPREGWKRGFHNFTKGREYTYTSFD